MTKSDKPTFKVGDVVKCIDDTFCDYVKEEHLYIVTSASLGGTLRVEGCDFPIFDGRFELVNKTEEKKEMRWRDVKPLGYSVGDTVKCINDKNCNLLNTKDSYIVKNINYGYYYVELEDVHGSYGTFRFKKAEEMAEPDKPTFKVGDQVRCIHSDGINHLSHGRYYRVESVGPSRRTICVEGYEGHIFDERFELVDRPEEDERTMCQERPLPQRFMVHGILIICEYYNEQSNWTICDIKDLSNVVTINEDLARSLYNMKD